MNRPAAASDPSSARLDVWLHAVRLAKTRSAAKSLITAGHVRLNSEVPRASAKVAVGDEVRIRRPGHERIFVVRRLLAKRVGAPIAQSAYEDVSPPPPPQLFAAPPRRERGSGRPTKKERRALDRLRGRAGNTQRRGSGPFSL